MTYPAPEPEVVRDVDWYDGPLAGLCRIGRLRLWFTLDDEVRVPGKRGRRRVHNLHRISDADWARIEAGDDEFPAFGELIGVWYEGAGVVPAGVNNG